MHLLHQDFQYMPNYSRAMLTEELRLITRIAYLYHTQQQKQSEIAKQLDISQATVSRMLKRAEESGIVRITVNMPAGVYAQLEDDLRARYNLKTAIVVHCEDESEETIFHHIGSAAAYFVETTIGNNEVVGLSSWSSSLLAMVNAMHPLNRPTGAKVVQMLGGVGNPSAEVYAARITERFANLVHGQAVHLPVPGVVSSVEVRDELLAGQFVREAVGLFEQVTLALVGIGSIEPSKLLASSGNVFAAEELELLRANHAVGDICLRFFDRDGAPVITPLIHRVISMPLELLTQVKRSVGVAGGPRKTEAIRGALNGGWINILITDQQTASRLLE